MKTHTDVALWSQRESEADVSRHSLAPGLRKVLVAHLLASREGQPAEGRWQKRGGEGWLLGLGWERAVVLVSWGCWC